MPESTRLRMPADESRSRLQRQIQRGEELLTLPVGTEQQDTEMEREEDVWHSQNLRLLTNMFSDTSIVDDYQPPHIHKSYVPWTRSTGEIVRNGIRTKVGKLQSYLDEIDDMSSEQPAPSGPASGIRVFISHSSKDEGFVTLLTDLLIAALPLERTQIRATSVAGFQLKAGDRTAGRLLVDIASCDVLIGVLTTLSLNSAYVLFELGAGWGLDKYVAPILGPDTEYQDVSGPIAETHIIDFRNGEAWRDLLETMAQRLGMNLKPEREYSRHIDRITRFGS